MAHQNNIQNWLLIWIFIFIFLMHFYIILIFCMLCYITVISKISVCWWNWPQRCVSKNLKPEVNFLGGYSFFFCHRLYIIKLFGILQSNPSIFFPLSNSGLQGCWSPSQLPQGERQGTPWSGGGSVTGPTQRPLHSHSLKYNSAL